MFLFKALFMIFTSFSEAAPLTEKEVLVSSFKNFPEVKKALLKFQETAAKQKAVSGAFDTKIVFSSDTRTSGFYDGQVFEGQIEKQLPFLGSKVYTGYRRSSGQFPVYDSKSETLDRGESFLGFSLSLLRDSLIDERRFDLLIAKENTRQSELEVQKMKLAVQTLALKAYWTWVVKGHEMNVNNELLRLAKSRASKIERRIKAGDLARIYSTENTMYIQKREILVKKVEQEFEQAKFYLSLFYRDLKSGRPLEPSSKSLPAFNTASVYQLGDLQADYSRALNANPELKVLGSELKQAKAQVRIGNNELIPKLDLKYEWSKDHGDGSNTLQNNENRVFLNLEIPIEINKGLGKKRVGLARKNYTNTKIDFLKEKLVVEIKTILSKIKLSADVIKLTGSQIELAKKLVVAEDKKFSRGSSDLILLNLREQDFAEAQIKNLSALGSYHFYDAERKELLAQLLE